MTDTANTSITSEGVQVDVEDVPVSLTNKQTDVLGQSQIFTPTVINDIHVKAELGRYRMRGFSLFKKIPHWDELVFLPGTLTRFVIEGYREKCETKTVIGGRFAQKPLELDIPVYITGMSYGALSIEAKMALAKGASMAGSATCSGEGGMIPPERDLSTKWFYQVIQSRYGFNPHHLMLADAVEFFIAEVLIGVLFDFLRTYIFKRKFTTHERACFVLRRYAFDTF